MTGFRIRDGRNFVIREYRKGDFTGVEVLWNATGMGSSKRGDNEETIEKTLKTGGKLLIMQNKATGEICGTSWMTYDGRRIHLHHFGILPEYQDKGLARILLRESLKFVKGRGAQVKLEVHRTNIRAIELYMKNGFEHLGDFDIYIIRDLSKI